MSMQIRFFCITSFTLISLLFFGCATYSDAPPITLELNQIKVPPYVEALAPHNVHIMWETEEPMFGWLEVVGEDDFQRVCRTANPGTLHSIVLTNIPAGKVYGYRIAGTLMKFGSFVTPSPDYNTYHFGILGDNRTHPDRFATIAKKLASHKCDLVIHSGDIMSDGANRQEWYDQWFTPAAPLLRYSPVFVAWGNHEKPYDPKSWLHYYYPTRSQINNRGYFTYRYGPVQFIHLNTYEPYTPGSQQYTWLDTVLAENDADFTICVMHVSPISGSAHARDGDVINIRKQLLPLILRYDVDLLVTGHDHTYDRSVVNNTQFLVAGGAGAPLYGARIFNNPYSILATSIHNFAVCSVNNSRIEGTTYNISNEIVDTFTLTPRMKATPPPAVATFNPPIYDYLDKETFSWDVFISNFSTNYITGKITVDAPPDWTIEPGISTDFFMRRDESQRTITFRAWPQNPHPGKYPLTTRVLLPDYESSFSYDLSVLGLTPPVAAWECDSPATSLLSSNTLNAATIKGLWRCLTPSDEYKNPPIVYANWPQNITAKTSADDVALHRIRLSGTNAVTTTTIRWYMQKPDGSTSSLARAYSVPVNNQWYTHTFHLGRHLKWVGAPLGFEIKATDLPGVNVDIDYVRFIRE